MFSWEFCEIFKSTFFTEYLTATVYGANISLMSLLDEDVVFFFLLTGMSVIGAMTGGNVITKLNKGHVNSPMS